MLWYIVAGVAVVALIAIALARGRRHRAESDLGTISQAWIAEHRSSTYDR